MKKYKAKTLLLSALIAGMVGAFCLSGCGKSSAAPISVTQEQSQTGQAKPVKIAKLSMDGTIIAPLAGSVNANQTVSKKIQAIIEPSTAKNASVDWSVEWGEKQNGAVTDYLTVTPDSDGSLSATVTCKQPFTGEIVVVCVTRQGKYVATCTVTYAGQPTEITLTGSTQETDGAYRFGIGNTYEYAVEMSNPFGSVGEKFNNVTVSVTGVGQVILGYMEHFQAQNKDKWYDTSDETVEYDSLKDALISASFANGKLTIKTLSAVEDFYRGTGRMDGGRTIFYEGKFRSYVTECYFNVTLTERNSGCSKTIKVVYDPGVVTGVNMSQNEMEF